MTELISSHKESDVQKDLYNMAHRTSSYQWQEQDSHCQSRAASFTMGKETQKEKKKRRSGRLVAGEAHVTNTHPKQWLLLYTFEDSTVNQPSNKTYTKCCRPPSHLLLSNVLNNQNSDYIYLRHWWIWKVFSCHLPASWNMGRHCKHNGVQMNSDCNLYSRELWLGNAAHRHLENNYALHDTFFWDAFHTSFSRSQTLLFTRKWAPLRVLFRKSNPQCQFPSLVKVGVLITQVAAVAWSDLLESPFSSKCL